MQISEQEKSQVFDSQADFTLTKIYSIPQYIRKIWNFGLITYGGPMAHIGIFRKKLVQEMGCVTDQQFTQLMTICQSIPGPTSTQLLTCISMYATASFLGGLTAFIVFSLPTFIIMFICGLSITTLSNIQQISFILPGLRIVAVAIIMQAFWRLLKKIVNQKIMLIVVISTAILFVSFPSSYLILIIFTVSGLLGYLFSNINQGDNLAPINNRFDKPYYGLKNTIFFVITLIVVLLFLPEAQNVTFIIFGVFYKIGALVIGGGHVILPLMYTSFDSYELLDQLDFANGFSIISVMPGPMFNLSVYIGTFIEKSIIGGIAAFFGLYIPCFLFIMTILPYWQAYRSQIALRKIISGVCSSSIGLILAAAIMLWIKQSYITDYEYLWAILITIIIVISFILLEKDWPIPIVFLIGGSLYVVIKLIKTKYIGEL